MNTANATVQADTWESRINNAAEDLRIQPEELEAVLSKLGIEKGADGLRYLSDEEILPFGDFIGELESKFGSGNIPKARVRAAIKTLRGAAKPVAEQAVDDPASAAFYKRFGLKPKIGDIDVAVLLEYYRPDKPSNPVTVELKRRFDDKRVIAFAPDSRVVHVQATANYVADLEQGFPESETVEIDGSLVRLYKVGELPDSMLDEDPMFPGAPLRSGRSMTNRINWTNVPTEVRQLVRLIVNRGDVDANDRINAIKVAEMAGKGMDALKAVYPEAELEYREKKQTGDLPKLRIPLSQVNGKGSNDPFGIGRNRRF